MKYRLAGSGLLLAMITSICSGLGIIMMKVGVSGDAVHIESFLPGLAIYGAGIVFGIALLKAYPLSVAYPMVVGLSLAVVAAISALWPGEVMTLYKLRDTISIMLGVILLAKLKNGDPAR